MSFEVFVALAFWSFIGWIGWRLFGRRIKAHAVTRTFKSRWQAKQVPEEAYYAQAAEEISRGQLSTGLWAKAWSEANGDKPKAEGLYIRLRVDALRRQVADRLLDASSADAIEPPLRPTTSSPNLSADSAIVDCPRCSAKLRVAARKMLDVSCPKCGAAFRAET